MGQVLPLQRSEASCCQRGWVSLPYKDGDSIPSGLSVHYGQGGAPKLEGYCTCLEGKALFRADDHIRAASIPPLFADCKLASYPSRNTLWFPKFERLAVGWAHTLPDGAGEEDQDEACERWIAEFPKESIYLYGLPGRGKTGLAVAALKAHIRVAGCPGRFVVVPELLTKLRASFKGNNPLDITGFWDVDALVLDDIGVEHGTDWVQETLFSLINHRHDNQLWTLFTSNLDLDGLALRIGERPAWRIAEMCTVFHVEGPNLRLPGVKP